MGLAQGFLQGPEDGVLGVLGDADDRVRVAFALGRQGPLGTVGGEEGRGFLGMAVVVVVAEFLRELSSGSRGRLSRGGGTSGCYQEGPV